MCIYNSVQVPNTCTQWERAWLVWGVTTPYVSYCRNQTRFVLETLTSDRPHFSGAKRRLVEKWDTYRYVSLINNLCKLLNDDTIVEKIDTCSERIHTTGLFRDFCDGSVYHSHPLFSQDSSALQIVAYYDEL